MTHEAAGVPTTRNDDDRQDNDRQREQHARNEQYGRGEPPEQHGRPAGAGTDTGAGPGAGDEGGSGTAAGGAGDGAPDEAAGGDAGGGTGGRAEGERPEARLAKAVRAAEQALIEFEIAVETFRVEVENFSRLHHQKLGPMYTRLDELDAQIAEARAARTGDPEDIRKAQEARAIVMPMPGVDELFHDWIDSDGLSPEAAAMLTEQPVRPPKRVRPTEEARKLYRDLARQAHPDLAQDETERARRDEFIARVNAAYGRGDEALLIELAQEWAAGPVAPEAELSESEELYARLNWLTQRKELLTVLAQELEKSAIGAMLRMAPDDPDRLLDEIAEQLLGEVAQREAELASMVQ
ncbi:J domain-containing protein [Streptomyces sp. NBC_00984]|uniref:J domain-containing protein n=1 Tax=Streptomyces sp. NBC_00984 TaxID=2903700 RepID=UPI003864B6F2|nr:J domain-containing protein [Streptomyces sp. NBC_00984]